MRGGRLGVEDRERGRVRLRLGGVGATTVTVSGPGRAGSPVAGSIR